MSAASKKQSVVLLLAGFSLAFLLGMFRAGWQIVTSRNVASWPTTLGVVVATGTRYDSAAFGDDFVPVVRFRYQVAGTVYESTRIWRYATGLPKRQAEQVVDQYSPGMQVLVHYDPNNPETGVLKPGLYSDRQRKQTILFGIIMLVVFWMLAILALRRE